MNVLIVTANIPEAGLIGRHLATLLPGLHFDVASDVTGALNRSTVPGRFQAVILDAVPDDASALGLIRTLRARDSHAAIIALAATADLDAVVRLMAAGADDCVWRRAGFVETLPGILRRACSRYESPPADEGSARVLYGGETAKASAASQVEPAPTRRDITGAASFLLRDHFEGESSPDSDAGAGETPSEHPSRLNGGMPDANAALEEEAAAARRRWEQERALLEDRFSRATETLRAVEEERSHAMESVRALQEQLTRTIEEFQAERQQWDVWRTALKQRLAAVEESALRIEDARRELELERRRREEENAR